MMVRESRSMNHIMFFFEILNSITMWYLFYTFSTKNQFLYHGNSNLQSFIRKVTVMLSYYIIVDHIILT